VITQGRRTRYLEKYRKGGKAGGATKKRGGKIIPPKRGKGAPVKRHLLKGLRNLNLSCTPKELPPLIGGEKVSREGTGPKSSKKMKKTRARCPGERRTLFKTCKSPASVHQVCPMETGN